MRTRSLARRLLLISAIWSALALLVAGVILVALYRQSVERGFDERLDVYLKTIVAELASGGPPDESNPIGSLGEPRFGLPLSGWYWSVAPADGGPVIQASRSLAGDTLALPDGFPEISLSGEAQTASVTGPGGDPLRVVSRVIALPDGVRYAVTVAGDATEIRADVAAFGTRVALTLIAMGAGLVLAILLQVKVGLKPLERIRSSVQAIRVGEKERLDGDFPREIAPLASELNELLDSHREVVERSRTHVGNLAHALKTPLSVILNEARDSEAPFARKVEEQANAMQVHIAHHLDRARIAAERKVIGSVTPVQPVVDSIARAMRRLYEEKGVLVRASEGSSARFRGDRQDLMELLGNLVDNGCKWARRDVMVDVRDAVDADAGRAMFEIVVEDDGPGLAEGDRERVLQRGRRLDESKPGSGLGLSIVSELVRLYGGSLELKSGSEGGLRVEVRLPGI
ncbi:ATP-binding protein [Amorphus orientalis]|uniref:histidine kinase n=1 Tax=Amorphus orientalis TaxID=649198 RepID=A0AAE3VMB5_9HYPH|nr:ATP-binding protein [Amorphus orientalis]MDQ0315129.1 signal transduction histidine kinase [Amorphus orientalis]